MSEATPTSTIGNRPSERRTLPRQTLESLSYVDLGDSNGGIILNVSEGGLAFRAAIPVMDERIPKLRFQLSSGDLPVEVEGRVAWTADENRMVGVTFVQLEADVRERLKNWITLAANSSEIPAAAASAPARRELALLAHEKVSAADETVSLESNAPAPPIQKVAEPPRPVQASKPASVPSAPVIAPPVRRAEPSLEGISIDALLPGRSREKSRPSVGSLIAARSNAPVAQNSWKISSPQSAGNPNLQVRAPVVILLAVAMVVAMWMLGRGGSLLPAFSDSASSIAPPISSSAGAIGRLSEISVIDLNGRRRVIPWDTQQAAVAILPATQTQRRQVATAPAANPNAASAPPTITDGAAESADSTHSVTQMWSLPRPSQSAAPSSSNTQQQSQLPSLKQNSEAIPGALPSALSASRLDPPAAPVMPLTESLSTSPSPKPFSGPHAGVLIRRVEPIYPLKAAAEKIEGIIAMQVLVGKDGKVHSVKFLSGPKALEAAAVDAVKLWRYEPAVVDGKPVESRQYVQLTFKIAAH